MLAADVRALDMRASPYDLRDAGYHPVPIETPEGKVEYVTAQRGFARRGADLRSRLLEVCRDLLGDVDRSRVPEGPRPGHGATLDGGRGTAPGRGVVR